VLSQKTVLRLSFESGKPTGLPQKRALDWIRTKTNFFGFELDRFKNLGSGQDFCGIFVVIKLYFVNFLVFIWTLTSYLKKNLEYSWTWTEFKKFRIGSGW